MQFYAYNSHAELGHESLGTEGKIIFNLKTYRGAIRRCNRVFINHPYSLYIFSNFYDDKTFRLLKRG